MCNVHPKFSNVINLVKKALDRNWEFDVDGIYYVACICMHSPAALIAISNIIIIQSYICKLLLKFDYKSRHNKFLHKKL